MTWSLFAIITGEDTDASLYPVMAAPESSDDIAFDSYDGDSRLYVQSRLVRIEHQPNGDGKWTDLADLPSDITYNIVLTDARVVVYSKKYDKGGGWSGFGLAGLAFSVAANTVSKARARSRSRGTILAGHLRYPWIKSVHARQIPGWLGTNSVYIIVKPSGGTDLRIQIALDKRDDAFALAHRIAQSTAQYRLARDPEMSDDERAKFTSLATSSASSPTADPNNVKATCTAYVMPTNWPLSSGTAYPAPVAAD